MKHKNHEWQLTNLELSKRLKELGVKQESLWWWVNFEGISKDDPAYGGYPDWQLVQEDNDFSDRDAYSAFTVAELYQIHWKAFGRFPSVIGLKPTQIANYLAEELIERKKKYK